MKRIRMVAILAALTVSLRAAVAAEPDRPSPRPPHGQLPSSKRAEKPTADKARGYVEPPGTEPEDIALFVPRLLLAVPRYALEFAFYPVVQTVAFLDRHAVLENIEDILYNDERTAGIVPKLSADTFFGATVGIKAFHDDLAGHGEAGSLEGRFGGRYDFAAQVAFRADRFGGSRLWLESIAQLGFEPALLFQGIGHARPRGRGTGLDPRRAAVPTRFRERRLLSLFRAGYTLGRPGSLAQVGATGIYNQRQFGPESRGSGLSTHAVYDTSRLVGFDEGISTLEGQINLILDTRDVEGATAEGSYIEVFAGGVPRVGDYSFWHFGAEAVQYFDLYRGTRVLILRAALEGVDGAARRIPFSDLPRLGGGHRLRGYPLDRFRDEKAALGTLEYHYPIHQYVSGALYVDAGRVAPSYAELFDSDDWNAGGGAGFIVRSRDRMYFRFDFAYGDGLYIYLTTDALRAFTRTETEL